MLSGLVCAIPLTHQIMTPSIGIVSDRETTGMHMGTEALFGLESGTEALSGLHSGTEALSKLELGTEVIEGSDKGGRRMGLSTYISASQSIMSPLKFSSPRYTINSSSAMVQCAELISIFLVSGVVACSRTWSDVTCSSSSTAILSSPRSIRLRLIGHRGPRLELRTAG